MAGTRRAGALRIALCTAVCFLLQACLAVGGPAAASGTKLTPGPARALPPTFYGVNFDYATTASYARDPDLDERLAALDPGTLRYPGGTGANDFSWQTGTPARVVDGFHLTLPVLAAAARESGAVPVFDLNLATTTLADQIAMLQQARALGLPVRYVELGNEVYSGFPDVKKAFPTAADYGAAVGADVPQLHAAFPGVEVGADGYLRPNPPARDRDWNRQMLAAAAAHGGLPDALILHAYAAAPAGTLRATEVPSLLEEPYQEIDQIRRAIAGLPSPAPSTVWLTEYNLRPRGGGQPSQATAQHDVAHGLLFAAYMLLLPRVPQIAFADSWAAFGNPGTGDWSGPKTNPELTPAGLAAEWVQGAARGSTTVRPLDLDGGPFLPGREPAVVGALFAAPHGPIREVLVNLSSRAVTVSTSSLLPADAGYRQAWGSPVHLAADAGALQHRSGRLGASLSLPAYSITAAG